MTACPAPHRTTKYTAVGSSAVSVFGLEDAGWADVLLEQSCLRCAKRLSGAHLPSCCLHINCPNRILDGPRKFRCVCISLLRPSPLPVRGKPIRWGWLSLLTVVVFARRRLPTSFLMRAHCPSTPQISTRSSQRAAYDGPPPVHVRCARSRARASAGPACASRRVHWCTVARTRCPSAAGGCFCIFGIEPRDSGIQPRDHGHGIQRTADN